jgi:hypothetical protein
MSGEALTASNPVDRLRAKLKPPTFQIHDKICPRPQEGKNRMSETLRYPLSSYADPSSEARVFSLRATPDFSPLDVNVAFLARSGWNQSVDRLRFHIFQETNASSDHPLAQVLNLDPHLLIRQLDRDEDRFVSIHVSVEGEIMVLSNDPEFARAFFDGLFLECPPSFHTSEQFEISEEWQTDDNTRAFLRGCWPAH